MAAESILVFRNALPFAGRCRNEDLGRFKESEGDSKPSMTLNRRPWGARDSFEEGNLYPPRHAASHAGRGEVLRSGYLGSREGFVIVSTSRCRKRRLDRCAVRKRRTVERWPSGFQPLGVLAAPGGEPCRTLRDSLPTAFEEKAACASRATSKEAARGAKVNAWTKSAKCRTECAR